MAIIDDLNSKYAAYRNAQIAQLNTLCSAAGKMVYGFGEYLGLANMSWTNPSSGQVLDYVRLGKGDENTFEEMDRYKLSSLNGVVSFSISITLEIGPNNYPKTHIIFPLSIREIESGFEFSGKDFPNSMLVEKDPGNGQFDPVYSAIVANISRIYDINDLALPAK